MFRPDDKTQGSGPTLSFVWWLSARAIAIDLAGRWTTTTPTMFLKVLELVRRLRPKQPLNGILVVIRASQFAPAARKDLRKLAEQMRDRVEEVANTLEFQVPVYLIVSQCDRMGGFEELFQPLRASATERDKLLGFTLPSNLARHGDPRTIELECGKRMERLVRALETYTVRRLREEWPRQESKPVADNEVVRGTALAGFVPRFRSVAEGVNEFVTTLVQSDIRPPILRGVFFSSATQTEANVAGELYSAMGAGAADGEKATALPSSSCGRCSRRCSRATRTSRTRAPRVRRRARVARAASPLSSGASPSSRRACWRCST